MGTNTSARLTNLVAGTTYFFAVTAYTADGLESDFSEEVSYTVPAPPTVVNTAPVAVADSYSTTHGTQLAVGAAGGVLANDRDADGDLLVAQLAAAAGNGMVVLGQDGGFTYLPNTGFAGVDTFTYFVTDGKVTSAIATVTITVSGVANRAPIASADTYSAMRKTTLVIDVSRGLLANDSDTDGDVLSAVLSTLPSRGKLVLSSNGSFSYSPNGRFTGTDTFTYVASDGKATSAVCVVTITVGQQAIASTSTPVRQLLSAQSVAAAEDVLPDKTELDGCALVVLQRESGKTVKRVARFSGNTFTIETPGGQFVSRGVYSFTRLSSTRASLVLKDEDGAVDEYAVTMGKRRWRGRRLGD